MYIFAEPVTEEQADEIQSAGEAAQKEFAQNVVGVGKGDAETQAAWQEAQDDVDEQVDAEKTSEEVEAQEDEHSTTVEDVEQDIVEETAEAAEKNSYQDTFVGRKIIENHIPKGIVLLESLFDNNDVY